MTTDEAAELAREAIKKMLHQCFEKAQGGADRDGEVIPIIDLLVPAIIDYGQEQRRKALEERIGFCDTVIKAQIESPVLGEVVVTAKVETATYIRARIRALADATVGVKK